MELSVSHTLGGLALAKRKILTFGRHSQQREARNIAHIIISMLVCEPHSELVHGFGH